MGYYGIENNQAVPVNPSVDVTYTINDDKITLDAPKNDKTYLLSCIAADGTWFRMSEYTGAVYTLNKEKTPNDIKKTNKENESNITNEVYYDLSGRKTSKSTKGVTIKLIKFNNGTQRCIKSINKSPHIS